MKCNAYIKNSLMCGSSLDRGRFMKSRFDITQVPQEVQFVLLAVFNTNVPAGSLANRL